MGVAKIGQTLDYKNAVQGWHKIMRALVSWSNFQQWDFEVAEFSAALDFPHKCGMKLVFLAVNFFQNI